MTEEEKKDYYKRYRIEHKEELKRKRHEYYESNKDRIKAKCKSYYSKNRDRVVERVGKTKYPHRAVYDASGQEWICAMCGAVKNLQVHHKDQDQSNNDISNLVCLCSSCHTGLHNKWLNEVIPNMVRSGIVDWRGELI